MTLHSWMHWFWVTLLLALTCGSGSRAMTVPDLLTSMDVEPEVQLSPERRGRAMYFAKTTFLPTQSTTTTTTTETPTTEAVTRESVNVTNTPTSAPDDTPETAPDIVSDPEPVTAEIDTGDTIIDTHTMPLVNVTQNETKRSNLTTVEPKDASIGAAESRIVTEKPLSLETTYLQTKVPNVESSRRVNDEGGGMDTGEIAGASFAALALVALAASTGFVVYRRRYLNKPQTLNDKCSNPDSSGYLDDSTVRDNSEEMYSLDNDSFLNSLEAMTIQNYWTDTVKHTKL